MITYNEIIKLLNDFYTSHYQVNNFENGDLWEAIESKTFDDALYPLAFLVDAGANTTKGKLGLTFDLLCMDLVDKGEANENEVKSDTLQILTDTVSYLKQLNDGKWYTLVVEDSNNLSSFTEKMSDELTGWKITITLTQPFNYDACSIPYAGVSLVDGDCLPVTINKSNGSLINSVASGSTYAVADSPIYINNIKLIDLLSTDSTNVEVLNTTGNTIGTIEAVCVDSNETDSTTNVFNAEPLLDVVKWQPIDINTTGLINGSGGGGVLVSSDNLSLAKIDLTLPYVVFIGDSICQGVPALYSRLNTNNSIYDPSLVSEWGQINYELSKSWNIPCINQGISGHSTTQVRDRWDRDVLAIPTAVGDGRPNTTLEFGAKKPDLVYIHCGINDGNQSIPTATTKSNIEFFATSCLANNIQLVMSNVGGFVGITTPREAELVDINNWIDTVFKVAHPEVTIIDYLGWSTDFTYNYGYLRPSYFTDIIHPNRAGYVAYAQYIYDNCNPIIKSKTLDLGYGLDTGDTVNDFDRITEFIFNKTYYEISGATSESINIPTLKEVDTPIYELNIQAVESVTGVGAVRSTGLSTASVGLVEANFCTETINKLIVEDSVITNEDGSVTYTVDAEGKIVIPNINFTDSNGSLLSIPAFTDIVASACGITEIGGFNYFIGGEGFSSNNITDQFGNLNDGTTPNGVTVNSNNFELDGINQQVDLNNGTFSGDYTIMLKFKLISLTQDVILLTSLTGGTTTNYSDTIKANGDYFIWAPGTQAPNSSYDSTINFNTTDTYKLAIVNEGTTTTYYLNGVLIITLDLDKSLIDGSIGAKYQGLYGNHSNIELYSSVTYTRALTSSEVASNNSLL